MRKKWLFPVLISTTLAAVFAVAAGTALQGDPTAAASVMKELAAQPSPGAAIAKVPF